MKFLNFFSSILICISCVSCAQTRQHIIDKTTAIAASKNLSSEIYQTKNFKIFSLKKVTDKNKNLRVYIEGDGKAFIDAYTVSSDPTPTSYFLVNLLVQDNSSNILYIARPCQYIMSEKCLGSDGQKYWTDARFSQEVVESIEEVLQKFPQYKIELIGYSGGAEIAKYIAVHNKNVVNFRTIAGNLDQKKFAEIHHVPALEATLKNQKELDKLQNIPQMHFVGGNDKIVPHAVLEAYRNKFSKRNCVKVFEVVGASHFKGWDSRWSKLLEIKPTCNKL